MVSLECFKPRFISDNQPVANGEFTQQVFWKALRLRPIFFVRPPSSDNTNLMYSLVMETFGD